MIKTRVIPLLLLKDGLLKKPVKFVNPRTIANPISIIRVFEARQVDELILLDIGSGAQRKNVNPDVVRMITEELTVPFACGGGINETDQIAEIIAAGAEKVVINTAAVETPELVEKAAAHYGRQCIVVSIDARKTSEGYEVFIKNASKSTGLNPVTWAQTAESLGAGEILINAIDRDGTMEGYDLTLIRMITDSVDIPVIAAGGAGKLGDFPPAILKGHANAVAAASIYHYTKITPNMVKKSLQAEGIPVRL